LLIAVRATGSNRDPLSELTETIVAQLLDGVPAKSRVNKGWDLQRTDGRTVEVKYVANGSNLWINGHDIRFPAGRDEHALVVIVDLVPQVLLVFDQASATQCYEGLNKNHDRHDDHRLLITPTMLKKIWTKELDLSTFSVEVIPLPWAEQV
jgi:hypothetical protein